MPAPFPEAISRFCNTRSFSGGHFQGPLYFLDFRLPRPPKWGEPHKSTKIVDFAILLVNGGEPHKSTKIVDFAIPAPFPEAISKAPCISWISSFRAGNAAKSRDFVPEKPSTAQNPFGRTTKKLRIRQLSRGSLALARKSPRNFRGFWQLQSLFCYILSGRSH